MSTCGHSVLQEDTYPSSSSWWVQIWSRSNYVSHSSASTIHFLSVHLLMRKWHRNLKNASIFCPSSLTSEESQQKKERETERRSDDVILLGSLKLTGSNYREPKNWDGLDFLMLAVQQNLWTRQKWTGQKCRVTASQRFQTIIASVCTDVIPPFFFTMCNANGNCNTIYYGVIVF